MQYIKPNGLLHFFELCASKGISAETATCLIRSINTDTLCSYLRIWKQFSDWCAPRQINLGILSINHICEFLIFLFKNGHKTAYLNVARSSLSFFLSLILEIGEDPRVKRLFRFFWKRRPSFPRYYITWDIKKVLSFLATWHPPSSLSFKQLTQKTLVLTAITSSDRAQTLQNIDIENSEITHEGIYFPIYSLLKCSKRNRPVKVVKCVRFDDCPALDVSQYVVAYLQRSFPYRARAVEDGYPKPKQLFLSYHTGKPLRRGTISKYILEILKKAGINVSCFKAHTTRGSLPSVQASRGASPGVILAQGDWKSLGTFERFYQRHADTSVEGRLIQKVTGNK